MKKLLIIFFIGMFLLLTAYFLFSRRDIDLSANEYTLTFVSYPGDRVELYEYVDYSDSHHGREIFYDKEISENGELSVKLIGGKYAIWAKCLEMSCHRAFDGPRAVNLNKDKVVRLKWVSGI
jgi:hypothetical protein